MAACLKVAGFGVQLRELPQDAVQGSAHSAVGREIPRLYKCCITSLLKQKETSLKRLENIRYAFMRACKLFVTSWGQSSDAAGDGAGWCRCLYGASKRWHLGSQL